MKAKLKTIAPVVLLGVLSQNSWAIARSPAANFDEGTTVSSISLTDATTTSAINLTQTKTEETKEEIKEEVKKEECKTDVVSDSVGISCFKNYNKTLSIMMNKMLEQQSLITQMLNTIQQMSYLNEVQMTYFKLSQHGIYQPSGLLGQQQFALDTLLGASKNEQLVKPNPEQSSAPQIIYLMSPEYQRSPSSLNGQQAYEQMTNFDLRPQYQPQWGSFDLNTYYGGPSNYFDFGGRF